MSTTKGGASPLSTFVNKVGLTYAQYLAFNHATKEGLAKIDNSRTSLGEHTRMSIYADIDLLIYKANALGNTSRSLKNARQWDGRQDSSYESTEARIRLF